MQHSDIERSKQILTNIKNQIKKNGSMTVSEFIQHALYTKNLGYYMQPNLAIGDDFITAPQLGNWLAFCISISWKSLQANQLASIIEYGPGSGKLCFDILSHCERLNCVPKNYYLIEISSSLRQKQQTQINQLPKHLSEKVKWVTKPPKTSGLVIANEFFDAWPIEQFHLAPEITSREIHIDKNEKLDFCTKPLAKDSDLFSAIENLKLPYSDYYSEIQLNYQSWFNKLYKAITQGAVLIIDYGMHQSSYYSPAKSAGTIRCHTKHRAHDDMLLYPGLQDITAQIDFTALANNAQAANWQLAGYCSQAQFMLQNGLEEKLITSKLSLQDNLAIKQLLMPSEMGEAFKAIGFSKNLSLNWFDQHNKVKRLFQ